MRWPVLLNHNHEGEHLGTVYTQHGCLIVELVRPMTREEMLRTFGNVGVVMLEKRFDMNGVEYITKFEIVEFSLDTKNNR